jgi:hypothetical protein
MSKNPHAVALGRKGGKANTPAQLAARRANGHMGGRRRKYRIDPESGGLQKRLGNHWGTLYPPLDRAAREALRRLKV